MKTNNILGLDLGVTSIGFAHVTESEDINNSEIKQIGVRINSLTVDEQTNFEKGRSFSINADRTLKRGARRNLDRYQDRRKNLIEVLTNSGLINSETKLTENGKSTTHETWFLRSKAVTERIEKEELARIFLAINKKRGYKSSRKAKNEDEGQAIDGMAIAKRLYEENLTPGQFAYKLLKEGKKSIPDFYRSDYKGSLIKFGTFKNNFIPKFLRMNFIRNSKEKGNEQLQQCFGLSTGLILLRIREVVMRKSFKLINGEVKLLLNN